jgi:8-oxo-dGTP pyrophosphatase MutT (NUDIX family)
MSDSQSRADATDTNDRKNKFQSKIKGTSLHKKFKLKHVFRGGAVIWSKHQGKDYYVVFKSKSRPNRGTQLPGGRIERYENPAEAILREAQEETGIETKVVCPLGMIYFENEADNYSSLQIYYLVRPVFPLNVTKKWKYIDKDHTKQELECWFEPIDKPTDYLAAGQDQVVEMFKQWLDEHKKPEEENEITEDEKKSPDTLELDKPEDDIFELN